MSMFSGTYCPSVAAYTALTSRVTLGTAATGETDLMNGGVKHRHVGGVTDASLRHFHDAMALVDADTKAGWTKAQAACSSAVLQHECCPCYFVRACQFNPWNAAVRMCSYWKERIELFEDRAFEAMTLGSEAVTPTGLTEEDVKLFETGTFLVLPKDRAGKTVLFVDEAELEPGMRDRPASRLRVLWYVLHAACLASTGGGGGGDNAHRLVVLYACYKPPGRGQYGASTWQFSAGAVKCPQVLPIVVDSIHLLTLQPKSGTGPLINMILAAAAAMLGNSLCGLTQVYHGTTRPRKYVNALEEETSAKKVLLWKLLDAGFTGKGLPYWAGGFFEYQDFVAWTRRRRRFEQKAFWTAEQRTRQKRDVNKAHSRKKRRRRHEELDDLQEQATKLKLENERARSVNVRLEQLVAAAIGTVAQVQAQGGSQPARIPTIDASQESAIALPESSCGDPFEPLSLEPIPIEPTHMSSRPASGGTARVDTKQLSDMAPPSSVGLTELTFRDDAGSGKECGNGSLNPVHYDMSPSDFAWDCQPSPSHTREPTTLPPCVMGVGLVPPALHRTVSAHAGVALSPALSESRNVPVSVAGPAFAALADCPTQQRPDRVAPTFSSHATALFLRAMRRHQPQSFSEANTMPSESHTQGSLHVHGEGPGDHRVPFQSDHRVPFRPHAQQPPSPRQFPSPCGGEIGRAEVWRESNSAVDGNNCDRRNGSVNDDGRVDVSVLFDLGWP
jgi:hypothetical protein